MLFLFSFFVKFFARASHLRSVLASPLLSGKEDLDPLAFGSAGGGPLDVPGLDAIGLPGGGPLPA
ncbi:hypothetical protein EVJ58_g7931 [Rhodofomes roseus]|uniref:Secreted protein n=1 Tax=Rhodofomes roseus TaxID=34475 RepID=A0A4Y9Y0Q3_9APHY|nr:hypothetical protein EVJ58_g7931 [Rhodofomes roseus]